MWSFFGSKKDEPPPLSPEQQQKDNVRKWQSELRGEMRTLDRQVRELERQDTTTKREMQAAAKKGDKIVMRSLAMNYVRSQKTKERLATMKANLNSISMQLSTQSTMSRVAGVMGKSTGIMKAMNEIIKAPELASTMRSMQMEMSRAGIIEEMMDDAFAAVEPEDLDAEADEEVEKLMADITQSVLSSAPSAPRARAPAAASTSTATGAAAPKVKQAVAEGEDDSMSARLDKL